MSTKTEVNRFKPLGKTKIIKGTVLAPENAGLRFVLSVNNMAGKPENPLFPIFDKKWKQVRQESMGWFATKTGAYKLGAVMTTAVQSDTWVIHMLFQDENLTTDLKALEVCLKKVSDMAKYEKASVHVSSILVNLVPEITKMLDEQLIQNGISVYYYEETQ
jgi:hypothetical protein